MERTTSVWSDRNIRDQLWKRLPLSIWQNHRSFESCFTYNARWLGSGIIVPLGTWNSENISAWQAKKLVGMGKEERWKRKVRARGKGKGAPSLPLSHQSPHFYPSFHSLPFYAGYERFFCRIRRGGLVHERRSRENKPLAQSALIYRARWTLTLSLICQSNRRSRDPINKLIQK